jgi:hypothetical protein
MKAVGYYGKELVEYYLAARDKHIMFPQYKTSDQSYSKKQFKAYVDLGYTIIMKELEVGPTPPCN